MTPLTLNTSEKNPVPIFSLWKSSAGYSAETAVFSARHEDPVTERSEPTLLFPVTPPCTAGLAVIVAVARGAAAGGGPDNGGPGPLCDDCWLLLSWLLFNIILRGLDAGLQLRRLLVVHLWCLVLLLLGQQHPR